MICMASVYHAHAHCTRNSDYSFSAFLILSFPNKRSWLPSFHWCLENLCPEFLDTPPIGTDPSNPYWQLCVTHVIKVETKERTKYTNKVTILKNKDMLAFFPENRKYYFGLENRLYVFNLILKVHNVVSILWKARKTSI